MSRTLLFLGLMIFISSCATGNLFMNKNSKLDTSTLITVEIANDPIGLTSQIEGKMMELGFEVVPYDIAVSKSEIGINRSGDDIHIASSNTTYVPTAVILRVKYTYVCTMNCSVGSLNIRIVDLNKERVLGNYSWTGMPTLKSSVINGFVSSLRKKIY